ncbi:hypothetical protein Vadar_015810 [Vaccinium darrowii]|uniref:Uncharacterized protein n=1 Tax=Vaccinium darrowii TaxID=229202 RepID=A0ACB7Y0Y7_9ERIC|nr:hypothetical protein Vadar_015810 [Vaccinium darrowii]
MATAAFSLSELLCREDFLSEPEPELHDDDAANIDPCTLSESDDEYIQVLIEKESIFQSNCDVSEMGQSLQSDSWLKCARLGSINWVLHNGTMWAIRLLSVACLSLAAKMEELNAPKLSKYQVPGFEFPGNVIKRMELMVLTTLEWKMDSITPFAYLNHFAAKFCIDCKDYKPQELGSTAVELILAIPKVVNLKDFRPSVIAVAAILAASDDQLTRNAMEIKMSVIPSMGSLQKEDIYYCYNLMQEIKMEKSSTPKSVVLSPNSSPVDVGENSSITSAVGTKRRLTYNDCDQNCPNTKIYRP